MDASNRFRLSLALVSTLCGLACSDSQSVDPVGGGGGYSSPVYADADKWLCRPGLDNSPCEQDFDATLVAASGETSFEPWVEAQDPAVDCFYVYPTINYGAEANAPFDGNYGAELSILNLQAVRFGSVCRVIAPLYRQFQFGGQPEPGVNPGDVAYGDVRDAFRHYMGQYNRGRGFILMGHSQGSSLLTRLVREEIDPNPGLRDQMVSAMLIGSTVRVPEGADVGGDFQNIPACRSLTDTGCVVSYASFNVDSPPPPTSFFARPRSGEGRALCVNPANPRDGLATVFHPYFQGNFQYVYAPGVQAPVIGTPFVGLPGLTSGRCVDRGEFTYLEVTVNGDPSDPRADEIGGQISPDWGLHAIDYQVAYGELVALADSEAQAWTMNHRGQ